MLPAARAHPIASAAAPVLAVLSILGLDLIGATRSRPLLVVGVLDESAHLLTAGLALAALARAENRTRAWVLLGAVVIDVDHVPLYLWGGPVAGGGGRPIPHSLATPVLLLALAVAVRRFRTPLVALAAGILLHFTRDVVTGPGLPLWWPVRPASVLLPYWLYVLLLSTLAGVATVRHLCSRNLGARRRGPPVVSDHPQ